MPDPRPSGSRPSISASNFSPGAAIVDIVAREGRAGLGIYITQEEQVLNPDEQIVLRRRHTLAVFPDKTYSDRTEEHNR